MELHPGDIINKDYKIINTLGKGAMSQVYLADRSLPTTPLEVENYIL
ncbi:MAG TPA: hypothetical protein PL110_14270 [Candidatus Eremiobacteraeota bacterium]|mgnify:CR=1 FL=1|nr:MAG: hypothetical protein BWY64_03318 [bacterium ADurb.Bin363]HPZ09270.1 hypothetical protein [Candidatus Eremiobacteraeota bacterium]